MLKIHGPLAALCALAALPAQAIAADAESQLRCALPAEASIYAREPGAFPAIVKGTPIVAKSPQQPPALMVDGWKPAPAPLATVLGELGHEAGFAVTGADGLGTVSWTKDKGTLVQALDDLTAQVGASWSFASGVVHVTRTPVISSIPATIAMPTNRDASLALLDSLRGYDAAGVTFGSSGISFSASPATLSKIESGLSGVKEVFAFDVSFYQWKPSTGVYSWSSIGARNIVPNGSGGRMILSEDSSSSLSEKLLSQGEVKPGGSQTVAGPSGWSLVVPQGQCGTGTAELTLKPKRVGDGFSMQISGFGAPVDVPLVTLGQTLLIAAKDPAGGWLGMVSIRPRILAVR